MLVTGRLEQREYETQQGEKRNVVEIVADEIGPSLRWARAEVERTSARTREGGGNYPATAVAQAVGPLGLPVAAAPADPIYGDEEPF